MYELCESNSNCFQFEKLVENKEEKIDFCPSVCFTSTKKISQLARTRMKKKRTEKNAEKLLHRPSFCSFSYTKNNHLKRTKERRKKWDEGTVVYERNEKKPLAQLSYIFK